MSSREVSSPGASASSEQPLVKSADRTLTILEVLARAPIPMSPVAIAEETSVPRSSLHALLKTLEAGRWITSDEQGRYRIGAQALLAGMSYLDHDPAIPYAMRTLEMIRDATGYTTNFARHVNREVLYLATREAADSERAVSRVGRLQPAYATALGRVLLAELTDAESAHVIETSDRVPLTEQTITDPAELQAEIIATRRRGHAREREQSVVGVCCVAVAVPYRIPATDAISCSIPVPRASEAEFDRVYSVLKEHTTRLAEVLRSEGIR